MAEHEGKTLELRSLSREDCHRTRDKQRIMAIVFIYLCALLLIILADIDECKREDNGGCAHNCTNTDGSYYCNCTSGYKLNDDRRNCSGKKNTLINL